jgi:hypothetical protein
MDFDEAFLTHACEWVLDRILECRTEEELEVLPKVVTLELKKHMLTLDEFTHITHCEDSLPEEERFERAKRFEEHVIQAASLALALVALEEQRKNPDHPSVEEENGSPSSTKISPRECGSLDSSQFSLLHE